MKTIRRPIFRAGPTLYWGLATLCFVAGAASRFYGAWACRYIRNPDTGIVALMVKHMAEGREWPIFFYGQAYMGSLEPMVSVLFTFLLGISGFAICAGTALMAVCSLPVIFCWARDAAGKAGANSIDSIAFDLSEPRIHRAEAIATATRHAIEDATVLAEASSLKLVRIMSITLDSAQPQPPPSMSKRMMMAGSAVSDAAARTLCALRVEDAGG